MPENFQTHFSLPRETLAKLERYAELLVEWNGRFNLVADSTLPQLWQRHFLDSAQLMKHLPPDAKTLADIGSGAGFPGLVLAIMGVPEVHLIESVGKKANFLRAVTEELKLNVTVHQQRAEAIRDLQADVVTARAVTALPTLLSLAKPLLRKGGLRPPRHSREGGNPISFEPVLAGKEWDPRLRGDDDSGGICLFLKGQNVDAELTEARKYWTFEIEKTPSLSDPSGTVLQISGLKILRPHGHKPSRKHE